MGYDPVNMARGRLSVGQLLARHGFTLGTYGVLAGAGAAGVYGINILIQGAQRKWDFKKVNYRTGILPALLGGVGAAAVPLLISSIWPGVSAPSNWALYALNLMGAAAGGIAGARLGTAVTERLDAGAQRRGTVRGAPHSRTDADDPFSDLKDSAHP